MRALSDFIRNEAGPCKTKDGVYLKVMTNEHGEIQLHPCTNMFCGAVFVFIPNDGWVYITNDMLCDRLQQEVKIAINEKAPGFRPWHSVPLYDEAGTYITPARRL